MNLPWIDIETTGLHERKDAILEIGVVITDEKPKQIDSKSWVIRPSRNAIITEIDPYVMEMHQKSGLWLESLSSKLDLDEVVEEIAGFIARALLRHYLGYLTWPGFGGLGAKHP
jgi:oligoribonuclease